MLLTKRGKFEEQSEKTIETVTEPSTGIEELSDTERVSFEDSEQVRKSKKEKKKIVDLMS